MRAWTKIALCAAACVAGVLGLRHATHALAATRPADMPADAQFLASGYDVNHNEPEGNWVVCRVDAPQRTDWCRVTDRKGDVVYQGDYLPVDGPAALGPDQLRVAPANPEKLWVSSPAHQSPVPVLPMANGEVLVPAEDEYALNQRWRADPREYQRVIAAGQ